MDAKKFKEEVNKTFYDVALKKINSVAKKYTNKLHFFFDRGEKLNLNYDKGAFLPTKFYIVHNPINIYDGGNKKITFIYDNGSWKLASNGENANFEADLSRIIGAEKEKLFIKDLLSNVKMGMSEYSKLLIKNKEAREARINSRKNNENSNAVRRLYLEDILSEDNFPSFRYILTDSKINNIPKIDYLKNKGITIRSVYYENGKIFFNFDLNENTLKPYLINNTSERGGRDFPKSISAYKSFTDEYLDPRAESINRYSSDSRKWGEVKHFTYGKDWTYNGIPKKWQEKIDNIMSSFLNNASKFIIKDMLKDKKYRNHIVNLRSKMEDIKTNGENFLGEKTKPFTADQRRLHRKASFSVNTNINEEVNYFPY